MEQTREVNIYEKTYLKKDGKTKFKKPYAILGEKDGKAIIIEASITNDCRKKMTKEEVETPCTLTLLNGKDKDYFIKKATYTNKSRTHINPCQLLKSSLIFFSSCSGSILKNIVFPVINHFFKSTIW